MPNIDRSFVGAISVFIGFIIIGQIIAIYSDKPTTKDDKNLAMDYDYCSGTAFKCNYRSDWKFAVTQPSVDRNNLITEMNSKTYALLGMLDGWNNSKKYKIVFNPGGSISSGGNFIDTTSGKQYGYTIMITEPNFEFTYTTGEENPNARK